MWCYQHDVFTVVNQGFLDVTDARLLHKDALGQISEQFLAHPESLHQFACLMLG